MEFHVSKKSFQSGKSEMNTRSLVLDCALPAEPGESRAKALSRAARNSGLTYARIVAFFYGKGNPPDEAREILRQAAEARRREVNERWGDLARRQRIAELQSEIERLQRDEAHQAPHRALGRGSSNGARREAADEEQAPLGFS